MEDNNDKNKKAAGYVRVSSRRQREEGRHKKQRNRLQNYAERNDLDIEIYEDIAVSGQSENRESYEDMMENIDEYDYLIVRELSRLGRSLKKILQDIENLEKKGVEFVSLEENIDTDTAHGKFLFQMVAAFNEFYANKRREETLRRIERKRNKGESWGRPKKLDEDQLDQVREWRESNISYSDISKLVEIEFGVEIDRSTIFRYCDEMGLVDGEDL